MRSAIQESASPNEWVIARGNQVYEERLKAQLEPAHNGRFVAIDPESGGYFLGDTDSEALWTAHTAMPEARFFLKRVGVEFTHRIGGPSLNPRWQK